MGKTFFRVLSCSSEEAPEDADEDREVEGGPQGGRRAGPGGGRVNPPGRWLSSSP